MLLIPKSVSFSDSSPTSTFGQVTVCFIFTSGILLELQYKASKMQFITLPIKFASFYVSCPDEYHYIYIYTQVRPGSYN